MSSLKDTDPAAYDLLVALAQYWTSPDPWDKDAARAFLAATKREERKAGPPPRGAKKPYCEHVGDFCLCDEYDTPPCRGRPKPAAPSTAPGESVVAYLEEALRGLTPGDSEGCVRHAIRVYRAERERDDRRWGRMEEMLREMLSEKP